MKEPATNDATRETAYARRLTRFDATMVVIGGIIGAGIFLNPAIVAERVGNSTTMVLVAWTLGGAIALVGALCFGELGARQPEAGGGYVYLREAFGALPAFLYGWTLLLVINTGAIAAVAVTFAYYAGDLLQLGDAFVEPLAVGVIALLTWINYLGIRPGSITQNIFTVLKLIVVLSLVVTGLTLVGDAPEQVASGAESTAGLVEMIGAALIPVLFAYGGWQHANHVAGEVVAPQHNLPWALMVGVAVVVVSYLLANWTYVRTLGVEGLAASDAPAFDAMQALLGQTGSTLIGVGIAISTFGFVNLVILAAPRVYQAMAEDGVFFERVARLHPRYQTPAAALLLQGAWAIVLTLSGTYGQLLDYVVFGDWIFFGLVVATLFYYRRRGGQGGGFRMPAYPALPVLFILATVFVVASSVLSNPLNSLLGSLFIAGGIPVYYLWRWKSTPSRTQA